MDKMWHLDLCVQMLFYTVFECTEQINYIYLKYRIYMLNTIEINYILLYNNLKYVA